MKKSNKFKIILSITITSLIIAIISIFTIKTVSANEDVNPVADSAEYSNVDYSQGQISVSDYTKYVSTKGYDVRTVSRPSNIVNGFSSSSSYDRTSQFFITSFDYEKYNLTADKFNACFYMPSTASFSVFFTNLDMDTFYNQLRVGNNTNYNSFSGSRFYYFNNYNFASYSYDKVYIVEYFTGSSSEAVVLNYIVSSCSYSSILPLYQSLFDSYSDLQQDYNDLLTNYAKVSLSNVYISATDTNVIDYNTVPLNTYIENETTPLWINYENNNLVIDNELNDGHNTIYLTNLPDSTNSLFISASEALSESDSTITYYYTDNTTYTTNISANYSDVNKVIRSVSIYLDYIADSTDKLYIGLPSLNDSYQNGYNQGVHDTEKNKETEIDEAETNGYNKGYNNGYSDAQNDNNVAYSLFDSILSYPVNFVKTVFNFELFGINLSGLICFIISLSIIAGVIAFILGKRK